MLTKKPYLSKTLIMNAVVAILALAYPPAAEFIKGNADSALAVLAALNMALRMVTKEKISLAD